MLFNNILNFTWYGPSLLSGRFYIGMFFTAGGERDMRISLVLLSHSVYWNTSSTGKAETTGGKSGNGNWLPALNGYLASFKTDRLMKTSCGVAGKPVCEPVFFSANGK